MSDTSDTSHPGYDDTGHLDTDYLDTGYLETSEEKAAPLADSGRHPLNVTHLVMGIVFAGFVGIWAALAGDLVGGDDVRWLLPVPWVLAGVAGLLAITFGGRRSRGEDQPYR